MIKRNIPKSVAPAEKLKEHSFTAIKAIDVTTAPTLRDNIYDITNMDVNLDGSLSIRKPLVYNTSFPNRVLDYDFIKAEYMFDNENIIRIYRNASSGLVKIVGIGDKIYDVDDNVLDYVNDVSFKGNDVNIINTVNSTIISGIQINLKNFAAGKFNSNYSFVDNYQYRYLKIVKENNSFKCVYIQPEIPTIETSETISLNYNTISDYVYAVRDNYQAQSLGVSAILPYIAKDKTITEEQIEKTTVRDLTESENFVTFTTVSETNSFTKYFLKAFLNFKSNILENCYCTWEKSYDGVSWVGVPEFVNNFNVVPIKIKDNSVSYESLDSTYDNSRTVLFCKLSGQILSNTDLITARPDVLILNNLDTATYRFKIILVHNESVESIEGISFKSFEAGELPIPTSTHSGELVSVFKFSLDPLKTYSLEKFSVVQKCLDLKPRMQGVSLGAFSFEPIINIVDKENILTITVKFKNVSLLSGFIMQTLFTTYAITYAGNLIHTENAKHLVYYTKENIDKLETISLKNIEQDYDVDIYIDLETAAYSAPDIQILLTPGEGKFEDMIKQYTSVSKNPYKFSLDSVTLKGIYNTVISVVEDKLRELDLYHENTAFGAKVVTDGRFGLPDGRYEFTYYTGIVEVKYGEAYCIEFDGNTGVDNAFILDWQNNDTSYDVCSFTFPTYFDSKHVAPSNYNGDAGNFVLAWQGPKNYNYIYFRNPDESMSSSEVYFTEIVKRVLEARTTLDIVGKTITPTESLGSLINTTYRLPSGEVWSVTKYPNIYDGVLDTTINSDEFEKIQVDDEENPLLESASLLLGQANWTLFKSNTTELLDTKIPNTVSGNKLYYKHRIYTYGKTFKNCIYVTDSDSFTTPLFNVIDLNASEDSYVTTLIPWRDYLIAATDSSIYIIRETEAGFTSKIVNTYIGIPEKDSKTCKSILNGIVFKSGTKIYSLQPSAYSSDDSILNIADISKAIANYVIEGSNNFAITTEQAYYVLIPNNSETLCLKYEFSRRIWTKYVYPIQFENYHMKSVENISVFAKNSREIKELLFEQEYIPEDENELYGDILGSELSLNREFTPIPFMFDSGQKTDDLSRTKQFVESKLILATLHDKDMFPLHVDISIDGIDFTQLHFDSSTDAALWKTTPKDILTLSTSGYSDNQDIFNVMRQMILRYSGKGKTIRHKVSGISSFNFKFYVLYYRYKNTHTKQ